MLSLLQTVRRTPPLRCTAPGKRSLRVGRPARLPVESDAPLPGAEGCQVGDLRKPLKYHTTFIVRKAPDQPGRGERAHRRAGAPLYFVGTTPNFDQINAQVPFEVSPGDSVPVAVSVGGPDQPVTIPVQAL